MMVTKLINRGEQISHESELGSFEAECAWSWTDDDKRTYPIYLSVRSVRYPEFPRRRTVPRPMKQAVAKRMKDELEAQESELVIELCK